MIKIDYEIEGDYLTPLLTLPKTSNRELRNGRFARMRLKYLKEKRKGLFEELLISGKLKEHLSEIEETAQNKVKIIIEDLAKKCGVNEKMKENDQLGWVRLMNNFRIQAEEIIKNELIYS